MAGLLRRAFERRGADVPITIDGVSVFAKEGDLLITAVLLHRSSLRRFEFGPGERAGFCWMGACQDWRAWSLWCGMDGDTQPWSSPATISTPPCGEAP